MYWINESRHDNQPQLELDVQHCLRPKRTNNTYKKSQHSAKWRCQLISCPHSNRFHSTIIFTHVRIRIALQQTHSTTFHAFINWDSITSYRCKNHGLIMFQKMIELRSKQRWTVVLFNHVPELKRKLFYFQQGVDLSDYNVTIDNYVNLKWLLITFGGGIRFERPRWTLVIGLFVGVSLRLRDVVSVSVVLDKLITSI